MCGISGCIDTATRPIDVSVVTRMTERLAHRGPDAHRVEEVATGEGPRVVFGHRRLAVIDLTTAATQPFWSDDGRIALTYNGEVYNFGELRQELESHGHVFRTRSDTEVVLRAYETWGRSCVERFQGMYAFAIWDGRDRSLLLARDRTGKKPLFYAHADGRLTFASELKALRCVPWVDADVDWSRVPELLAFGYVPGPGTFHRGISQVPPGTTMRLVDGRLEAPLPYWHLELTDDRRAPRARDWDDATAMVRERMREAVRRRLVSDVPLGVLLSGGLDSSAIVGLMAELGAATTTFAVGMADERSFDEREPARVVARHFGTTHVELEVRAAAATMMERVLWHLDEPLADTSAIPTYLIAEAAREHVTVVLSGEGGDEIFGGYSRFRAALLSASVPGPVSSMASRGARLLPRTAGYFDLRRAVERFTTAPGAAVEDRYLGWVGIFGQPGQLADLLAPELLRDGADPFGAFRADAAANAHLPLLHRLLHANFVTDLPGDLLVKMDRLTMAHSLEARAPLLDTDLIDAVGALPPAMKTSRLFTKRVMRRALKGLLPDEILHRRKQGFGVPVGTWFRGSLEAPFRDLLLGRDARTAAFLRREATTRLIDDHVSSRADHSRRLWALLALEVWARSLDTDAADPPAVPSLLREPRAG